MYEGGQLGCNGVTLLLAPGRVHPGDERLFMITFPHAPTFGQRRSPTSFRRSQVLSTSFIRIYHEAACSLGKKVTEGRVLSSHAMCAINS